MTAKKNNSIRVLIGIGAVLVIVALILSIVSSNTAYSLTKLGTLIAACAVAAVIDLAVALLGARLPEGLRDAALLVAVLATSLAMCTLVNGRTTLAGYIYFSDLESNNPVAIQAMHLAIGAVCAYLGAIVLTVIVGFKRTRKA